MILDSFGVTGQHRHIINGHVPVRVGRGETPIKANGKLMVIDGGFAKAYHHTTGIAGYTLVFHSRGFQLVQHEPFTSAEEAIKNGTDIVSTTQIVEMSTQRMMVRDTDKGAELESQIERAEELLYAYRHGFIKEKCQEQVPLLTRSERVSFACPTKRHRSDVPGIRYSVHIIYQKNIIDLQPITVVKTFCAKRKIVLSRLINHSQQNKISFGAERFLYIILPFHAYRTAVDGRARRPGRPMLPARNAIGTKDAASISPLPLIYSMIHARKSLSVLDSKRSFNFS